MVQKTKGLLEEVNMLTVYVGEERGNLLKILGTNEIEKIFQDEDEKKIYKNNKIYK